MTVERLRSYRFGTEAQWNACLFVEADLDWPAGRAGLRPFTPYARPATLYPSPGAQAPVITRTETILWGDAAGALHRLAENEAVPEVLPEGFATRRTLRFVATAKGLWALGDPPDSVRLYDEETLTRLLTVDVRGTRPLDIAGDGREGIWALIEGEGVWQAVRVGYAGHIEEAVTLEDLREPAAMVFLARSHRFVVLTAESHARLRWFQEDGRSLFSVPLGGLRPCFTAAEIPCAPPSRVLGSDAWDRILLAGRDARHFGAGAYVLLLDADGNRLADVPVEPSDQEITGVAANGGSLLVTTERGLFQFRAATTVPEGSEEVRSTAVTPTLEAPDREDARRWLRIDALATLPEGSTLELSFAATDDSAVRDRLTDLLRDESLTATQRVRALQREPEIWRAATVFRGDRSATGGSPKTRSVPLSDVRERYLWVGLTLIASPSAELPSITQLDIRYPGRTLMDELPAIYRRAEAEPGSFIRGLVGVLETTTQDLDARIASLGSRVHPATASGPWLDYTARWLGVPWDDGLSLAQKQAILLRAAELAEGRGTRAGLEALLESLMPGTPRRFRVTDPTADVGFAMVGGDCCVGSVLPAMLGGRTRPGALLDTHAVLGGMRLPGTGEVDEGAWPLPGRIRVEVAATAGERRAWEPWMYRLLGEMVPLTARVELVWVSARALRTNRLDGTLTLEAPPRTRLGTDAVTGVARLPETRGRLSASGPMIGTRLR